jgi:hypothetical protein
MKHVHIKRSRWGKVNIVKWKEKETYTSTNCTLSPGRNKSRVHLLTNFLRIPNLGEIYNPINKVKFVIGNTVWHSLRGISVTFPWSARMLTYRFIRLYYCYFCDRLRLRPCGTGLLKASMSIPRQHILLPSITSFIMYFCFLHIFENGRRTKAFPGIT